MMWWIVGYFVIGFIGGSSLFVYAFYDEDNEKDKEEGKTFSMAMAIWFIILFFWPLVALFFLLEELGLFLRRNLRGVRKVK